MLRIQNIVPKHFIYWLSKIEMNNTLHRGVSLTNLVTRDEQRILYLVHLILFRLIILFVALMLIILTTFVMFVWWFIFRIIDFMIFRCMTIHMSCDLLVDINPTFPSNMNSITNYVLFIDRKSTRLNSSHSGESRMPSSA